jgi:hypothetical protein
MDDPLPVFQRELVRDLHDAVTPTILL